MSKAFAIIGTIGGLLALLSAFGHAFGGWPAMALPLVEAKVTTDIQNSLMIGWCWGSFCMAGFGLILLGQGAKALRGQAVDRLSVGFVSLTYVVFGFWAMLVRGFNPFFSLFVVTGLLAAALLKR